MHQYQTNTGNQLYLTQNLANNTMWQCQAPTQNQFQNPTVSQQQSHNNVQAPWQNYIPNPQTQVQLPQPYMQNLQVPLTHTQGAVPQTYCTQI